MKRCCLKNIGAEFFPCVRFREDGMAQSTGVIATFVRAANFASHLPMETLGFLSMDQVQRMLTRPNREPPVDEETDRIVRERDATFDKDKKTAEPWRDVKSRILDRLKHPQPR